MHHFDNPYLKSITSYILFNLFHIFYPRFNLQGSFRAGEVYDP